jgi:uncharacterized protein (UPF0333 family)
MTSRGGQVALEYILLLSISVMLALMVTSMVVSRNPESPGFLMVKWRQIIEFISLDEIER